MDGAREPIAAITGKNSDIHHVYCSDGSVWLRDIGTGIWKEMLPPLPGSARAREQGGAA